MGLAHQLALQAALRVDLWHAELWFLHLDGARSHTCSRLPDGLAAAVELADTLPLDRGETRRRSSDSG